MRFAIAPYAVAVAPQLTIRRTAILFGLAIVCAEAAKRHAPRRSKRADHDARIVQAPARRPAHLCSFPDGHGRPPSAPRSGNGPARPGVPRRPFETWLNCESGSSSTRSRRRATSTMPPSPNGRQKRWPRAVFTPAAETRLPKPALRSTWPGGTSTFTIASRAYVSGSGRIRLGAAPWWAPGHTADGRRRTVGRLAV